VLFSATAFILKVDILSEKDVVATLLTREKGLVRAVVHGARGKTKRAAFLQTLTEVGLTLFHREGADLMSVREVELVKSAFELACRPETSFLLPYLAESLLVFSPPDHAVPEAYRLVRHVLDTLQEEKATAPLATRYFEFWLLKLSGLFPDVRGCEACGNPLAGTVVFEAEGPHFLHAECAERGRPVLPFATIQLLRAFAANSLDKVAGIETTARPVLAGVEMVAREVRRRFLGFELKSYSMLGVLDPDPSSPC
jgi:DNA repair protein RecO (recombination protein O)